MSAPAHASPPDPLDAFRVVDQEHAAAAERACAALSCDTDQPAAVRAAAQDAAEVAAQAARCDGPAHVELTQLCDLLVALQRLR